MKRKVFLFALLAMMTATSSNAQQSDSYWTLNTRAWSTNYFTTMIASVVHVMITDIIIDADSKDSLTADRIIPFPNIVFPVGLKKDGFGNNDIYGPYHRAFSNPFKNIGDYGVGFDVSWQPSVFGIYAGAYFKSQEIVFKETDDNLRGYYFQPRAGISLGGEKSLFEAGVFYDVATGCSTTANYDVDKKILKNGLGLDFAFSYFDKDDPSSTTIQFSMPLHDMHKEGPNRRVGYIMITRRIKL